MVTKRGSLERKQLLTKEFLVGEMEQGWTKELRFHNQLLSRDQ
jgi:hypothetical protein